MAESRGSAPQTHYEPQPLSKRCQFSTGLLSITRCYMYRLSWLFIAVMHLIGFIIFIFWSVFLHQRRKHPRYISGIQCWLLRVSEGFLPTQELKITTLVFDIHTTCHANFLVSQHLFYIWFFIIPLINRWLPLNPHPSLMIIMKLAENDGIEPCTYSYVPTV